MARVDIQSPSQPILQYLENANLFIVPLDDERRWYRYHRLFADLLHKRLHQTHGDLVPLLHRRASEWHEQQGLMAAAIDHALAAEDLERAATLIEVSVEATLMRSEVATFLRWVERLPDELVRTRPTLCFYHAWALLMSGRSLEIVEQRLQDIACVQEDAAFDEVMPGRVAALRAYSLLFRADMPRAAELCRQALETLPESDRFLRSIVAWILSLAHVADGDLQDGSQELKEAGQDGPGDRQPADRRDGSLPPGETAGAAGTAASSQGDSGAGAAIGNRPAGAAAAHCQRGADRAGRAVAGMERPRGCGRLSGRGHRAGQAVERGGGL